MKEKLFVYGTLKEPEVQKRVLGRIIRGHPDALIGFRKSRIIINGRTYPILIPDAKSTEFIKGLVLAVNKEEIKRIDEHETKAYKRREVVLKSGTTVWVYQK